MKVLIACEFTGTVRRQFAAMGHDAWSCDLLPSADRSNKHLIGDVRQFIGPGNDWDLLMVAHPPCTRLCNSGVRWLTGEPPSKLTPYHHTPEECAWYATASRDERKAFMWQALDKGAALFSDMLNAPVPRICVENPVMHEYAKARIANYVEFTQSVQPYQFGHRETKRTCLWLKGLPPLVATTPWLEDEYKALSEDERRKWARVHNAPRNDQRWAERSKFFDGIAKAMAEQWGSDEFCARLGLAA